MLVDAPMILITRIFSQQSQNRLTRKKANLHVYKLMEALTL